MQLLMRDSLAKQAVPTKFDADAVERALYLEDVQHNYTGARRIYEERLAADLTDVPTRFHFAMLLRALGQVMQCSRVTSSRHTA